MKLNKLKLNFDRKGERGNVLFLILIAVALFAALSYAVTQSSRSGSGDANEETNLVTSASITQYPSSVRTAIIRMMVSGGIDDTELLFNKPADYTGATDSEVFHPSGGGATHVTQAEGIAGGSQSDWIFSSHYAIENIGTTANDIIAFLPNVRESVCEKINTELAVPSVPDADGDGVPNGPTTMPVFATHNKATSGIAAAATADFTIDGAFSGQPFGCFDTDAAAATDTDNELVYYHVLVER